MLYHFFKDFMVFCICSLSCLLLFWAHSWSSLDKMAVALGQAESSKQQEKNLWHCPSSNIRSVYLDAHYWSHSSLKSKEVRGCHQKAGFETYLLRGCTASTCSTILGTVCYCTRRTAGRGSRHCYGDISDCCKASEFAWSPHKTSLHSMVCNV